MPEIEGLVIGSGIGDDTHAMSYTEELAEQLGQGWTARPSRAAGTGSAMLYGPGGEEIAVTFGDTAPHCRGTDRGRILVAGLAPDELFAHTRGPAPAITVSAGKTPPVAAGDLRRLACCRPICGG